MSADQKFWLGVWTCVASVFVAICVMACIVSQIAHTQIQHSKQACFVSGQSWVDGNCVPLAKGTSR